MPVTRTKPQKMERAEQADCGFGLMDPRGEEEFSCAQTEKSKEGLNRTVRENRYVGDSGLAKTGTGTNENSFRKNHLAKKVQACGPWGNGWVNTKKRAAWPRETNRGQNEACWEKLGQ